MWVVNQNEREETLIGNRGGGEKKLVYDWMKSCRTNQSRSLSGNFILKTSIPGIIWGVVNKLLSCGNGEGAAKWLAIKVLDCAQFSLPAIQSGRKMSPSPCTLKAD